MAHKDIILIGSEKTIKPSSSFWGLDDGVSVASAYGLISSITGTVIYYVESCDIVNPKTGSMSLDKPILFENSADFIQDPLYDDISRFSFVQSSVAEFQNTFSGYELSGSEFAVALTAQLSEQTGYSPWVIIHPDEKRLIEFCVGRGWTCTVLGSDKSDTPQHVHELISAIASQRSTSEIRLISSRER